MTDNVSETFGSQTERRAKAIAQVSFAIAPNGEIDSDDQRLILSDLGSLDQLEQEQSIFQYISLKPQPTGCLVCHPLNGCRRGCRQRIRYAKRRSSLGDGDITASPAISDPARWRNGHGKPRWSTQKRTFRRNGADIDEHFRQQLDAFESVAVLAQRLLSLGATVIKIKDQLRQTLPGGLPQIFNGVCLLRDSCQS